MIHAYITIPSDSSIPNITVIGPPRDLPFNQVFLNGDWWIGTSDTRLFRWRLNSNFVNKITSFILLGNSESCTRNNLGVDRCQGGMMQSANQNLALRQSERCHLTSSKHGTLYNLQLWLQAVKQVWLPNWIPTCLLHFPIFYSHFAITKRLYISL